MFRQIGWFTIDPEVNNFPNEKLRDESNNELLNKVAILHDAFILKYQINTKQGYYLDFPFIVDKFHTLRKFRNSLLHSAYLELKAGGEVMGMLRTNPKTKKDPKTKDLIRDFDLIEAHDIEQAIKEFAPYAMDLSLYFNQLKHCYRSSIKIIR